MTFQQIISRVYELYPHGETTATILNHINAGQDELSNYFGKTLIDESLVTVASQDNYAFPAYCEDADQIQFVDIGNSATPTDRFDYTRYCFHKLEDGRPSGTVYFQVYSSVGSRSLGISPVPNTDNLPIRITFSKKLTEATAGTLLNSPEFDSRYHDLLVYYACHMLCASGASPDSIQADAFMQKFEDGLSELWRTKMTKTINAPLKRNDNRHWHR